MPAGTAKPAAMRVIDDMPFQASRGKTADRNDFVLEYNPKIQYMHSILRQNFAALSTVQNE